MSIWKIYYYVPHSARVVQSIRELSRVTGICKSFQVQKMTIQSTISLLFSSLSSFHLPGQFFFSQLLILFPCISRVISPFFSDGTLKSFFIFLPLESQVDLSENLAKCFRRRVTEGSNVQRQSLLQWGQTGRMSRPIFSIDTHFWKEIVVFFYEQPKGTHTPPRSSLGQV